MEEKTAMSMLKPQQRKRNSMSARVERTAQAMRQYIVRRNEEIDRNRRKKPRKHDLKEIVEMRNGGMTLRDIGKQIGVSHQRVSQLLAKAR